MVCNDSKTVELCKNNGRFKVERLYEREVQIELLFLY